MTYVTLGRWLLVALAVAGFAFAAPVVSAHGNDTTAAHGNETTADDAPTDNVTADEWATWMEAQMGVTVDERVQGGTADEHHRGMYGQGHC